MKRIPLLLLAFMLPSCGSLPVSVSYTGTSGGQAYSAIYSPASGAVLTAHQK